VIVQAVNDVLKAVGDAEYLNREVVCLGIRGSSIVNTSPLPSPFLAQELHSHPAHTALQCDRIFCGRCLLATFNTQLLIEVDMMSVKGVGYG
jgi:hypothetical protein